MVVSADDFPGKCKLDNPGFTRFNGRTVWREIFEETLHFSAFHTHALKFICGCRVLINGVQEEGYEGGVSVL